MSFGWPFGHTYRMVPVVLGERTGRKRRFSLAGISALPVNSLRADVDELALEFAIDRSTVYRRIRRLREVSVLEAVCRSEHPHDVADAVAVVFPYLVNRA